MRHAVTRLLAALVALAVVLMLVPDRGRWTAVLADRGGVTPSLDELVTLVAGAALWLLAVWVLLALTAGRLAAAPGLGGAAGRALVRATVPRVLRGVVVGGVAGGLLLGPAVAAVAAVPRPAPVAVASSTAPGPAWPTTAPAPSVTSTPTTTPTTAPPTTAPRSTTSPTTTAPPTTTPPTTTPPSTTTPPPTTAPGPTWPTGGAPTADPSAPAADVVVAPGDSLWSISADALRRRGIAPTDAAVVAAWPSWYAANRAVIGPDPGLLHPGTHLTAPSTTAPTNGSTP